MASENEKRILMIGESVKNAFGSSNDLDLKVGALKENGLTKVESMFVLARLFNVPLQHAKPFVHSSRHWSEEERMTRSF
jgi:hypothetical protein